MPSLRVLLRMFLILVLCADGILSAQATTRMAVRHIPPPGSVAGSHTVHGVRTGEGVRSNERVKISNDCNKNFGGKQAGQGDQSDHRCDCSTTSCDCSCVLTFFAGRVPVIFAAQHALNSTHLPTPDLPPLRRQVSRLFRPPIG
jgi:hypothetical protein